MRIYIHAEDPSLIYKAASLFPVSIKKTVRKHLLYFHRPKSIVAIVFDNSVRSSKERERLMRYIIKRKTPLIIIILNCGDENIYFDWNLPDIAIPFTWKTKCSESQRLEMENIINSW